MQEIELPPDLAARFREGRVILFIGAGCCRSAGLPGWEELLRRIAERLSTEHLLSQSDEGQLRGWFKKVEDYPRIAELFKSRFPQKYREVMQETFNPDAKARPLLPPRYFTCFRDLPVTNILTTNFDALIEDALGSAWNSLTWQDEDEIPRYLRESRRLIFHIHGRKRGAPSPAVPAASLRGEYGPLSGLQAGRSSHPLDPGQPSRDLGDKARLVFPGSRAYGGTTPARNGQAKLEARFLPTSKRRPS
jgi:hypothetical protein